MPTKNTVERGRTLGRYDLRGARLPANDLAVPPRSRNVQTVTGAVPDPYSARERLLVSVNRRTDVLENELSHGRISQAAYNEGRIAAAVFERASGVGTSNWSGGDRVDAYVAHELAIIYALEDARKVQAYSRWLATTLGMIDMRILRDVLTGMSFAEVTAKRGRAGERGIRYFAQRFRDALENLAEARAARGKAAKR